MIFTKSKYLTIPILCLLLYSCGPKKVRLQPEVDYIFFPSLPNTPRYQYLTTFSTSKDIERKKSSFFQFVVGKEEEKSRMIQKAYGVDIFDGVIYVCDIGGGMVVTLDLKSREFGYIGLTGSGKTIKPANLKVDKKNRILYVADIGRKQIISYDLSGKPLVFYGKQEQFDPSDVDFHDDRLFVCDVKGHKIHVLDKKTGDSLYEIGKPGSKDGELFHPSNIFIFEDCLYVSDTTNFRIQVFDLEGNFLQKYGQIGDRPGEFSRNKGIAVDKEGRIYVVDAAFENVQVFDKDFQLLIFMFGPGIERHNINLPAGIAIDYDNLEYFRQYLSPKFKAEYLIFVTSNFGLNKVTVYAFGAYQE
ncbi:MAG: 6-bladed beta-propeller [Candidatus Aminicenantes bacterium]|nr:6-bladed beta-propeller [Candidatus Aminicenantes bacterium]